MVGREECWFVLVNDFNTDVEVRDVVKVARVKKKTEVTHAIGTAKAQTKISDPRPGNGKQILFSKFDSNWITEVRNIKE